MERRKYRGRRGVEEWRQVVKRSHETKSSLAAFCEAEGVTASSLHYWRKRFCNEVGSESAPSLPFVELRNEKRASRWQIEVTLPNGGSMRVAGEEG